MSLDPDPMFRMTSFDHLIIYLFTRKNGPSSFKFDAYVNLDSVSQCLPVNYYFSDFHC